MTRPKSDQISAQEWFSIVCHDQLAALRAAWAEEAAAQAKVAQASEELHQAEILYDLTLPLRSLQRIPA